MIKSFASYSFGCRVNEAEKIKFDKELLDLGFVYSEDKPQIFVINSCAVTQKAEREVRQFIYQLSKKSPLTKIYLTGCAATLWEKNKSFVMKNVTIVPNKDKSLLVELINNCSQSLRGEKRRSNLLNCHSELVYPEQSRRKESSTKKILTSSDLGRSPQDDKGLNHSTTLKENYYDKFIQSNRLLLKIQDGCRRYCSYCIVPYLRGKPTSEPIENIVKTINQYSQIQEVILSAVNTEYFGKNTNDLIKLIKQILNKTKVPRISFGSIHPWSITDEFIKYFKDVLAKEPRFVQFMHIPLQSASDAVLKLMNRKYTVFQLINKLERLKHINPKLFIGTDIIVGFPGETVEKFESAYKILKSAPIDKFHVFKYSSRPGTAAIILEKQYGQVTDRDKNYRSKRLLNLGKKKYKSFIKSLVGTEDKALILYEKKGQFYQGLLSNQIPILIKSKFNLSGKIVPVKIEKLGKFGLVGDNV